MAEHVPPAIDDVRTRTLLTLADRLRALALEVMLVYRIESVPASALYTLAWQLAVDGLAGWDLAPAEAQRRDLVRGAIARHARKGTVSALRGALDMAGYEHAVIEELVDGAFTFRVRPRVLGDTALPAVEQDLLAGIVAEWQNVRSHFSGLFFSFPPVTDAIDITAEDAPMMISQREYFYHDSAYDHDATITHGGSGTVALGVI